MTHILPLLAPCIPLALQQLPQWVLYRVEQRNGKTTKVPYQPNGKRASVNDPSTWTSFREAVAAYIFDGWGKAWDGIGFVFTATDPFTGIDYDHCVDTTGTVDPKVLALLQRLGTYVEYSPSATGLHAIVRSPVLAGRRTGSVEVYSQGRYFTFTGNVLAGYALPIAEVADLDFLFPNDRVPSPVSTPSTLTQRVEGTDAREVLARMRRWKRSDKFERLWSGDTSGYASHSEADLALCAMLSFASQGDVGVMDSLFRQSRLMRPKWDKAHRSDGMTYGQLTIHAAIQNGVFYGG